MNTHLKEELVIESDISAPEISKALKNKDVLPLITVITKDLNIYSVISANSRSAQQSFSYFRRLKTYLSSMMCQSRLSSLTLIHIEHEFVNRVITKNIKNY